MSADHFNRIYNLGDEVICTDQNGLNYCDTLESRAYYVGCNPFVQLRRTGIKPITEVVCKYNPLDYGEAGGSSEIYGGH
jgi:hypothetical protein